MELQQAIEIVKANGYIVRKSTKGQLTRAGSLKDWRVKQPEPKVNFVCFKSRLRYAGILASWRNESMQILSVCVEPKDYRAKDGKEFVYKNMSSLIYKQ